LIFLSGQKANNSREVERMINEYGNDVLRISFMYLKDMEKAEDAFQEVFFKVFKKLHTFKGESSERTWIIRITINVCRDFLKSFWVKNVVSCEDEEVHLPGEGIEDQVLEDIENQQLFQQVIKLPAAYKEVILLYYYQGFNTVEVSKILDISEGTVRSRLFRARDLLKRAMTEGREYSEGFR
jgi:RNA polymerase sigma-70 factor, ECF subfamily